MDGLSGAASVIAVLQLATAVGSALKDYYEGVRDAREDIRKLYGSIKGLERILERLKDVAKEMSNETLLTQPLEGVRAELKELMGKLNISETRARRALQSLTWPFKKKDAEKSVVTIEKHKSSLNLLVGVENLHLGFEQFDITADIRADIRLARVNADRRRIVNWLSEGIPNPSKEHNIARERHEETTGSWLINDDNDYTDWLTDPNSFLWLNGGAGAGKSILCKFQLSRLSPLVEVPLTACSTIIDDLQDRCGDEPSSAVVYWYFTFTEIEKQGVSNCLRSLIADICSNRRETPQSLQKEYERANIGQQKPPLKSCIAMLKEVMTGFDHVYIVLDALDECPKAEDRRRKLLNLLHDVRDWDLSSLHILVTSRRESDIVESFAGFPDEPGNFTSINVEGPQVEDDIKKYLQHQLQGSSFRKWKQSLRWDVEIALASKADGMFRLVALQLEALSKLRAESKIRSAMKTLPETLDEFYDRIILEISKEDQEYAYRALQWIAFAARPLSLKELAEAVIISPEREPCLDDDDRFMDSKDLLDVLPSGLISAVRVPLDVNDTIKEEKMDRNEGEEEQNESSEGRDAEQNAQEQNEFSEDSDAESGDDTKSHGSFTSAGYADHGVKLVVQFAHFSVKEYLISLRMLENSPVSRFNLNELSVHEAVGKSCLAYLLYVASQNPAITKRIYLQFPILHYAVNSWQYHLLKLEGRQWNPSVEKLAFAFLEYGSRAWNIWAIFGFSDGFYYNLQYQLDKLPFRQPQICYQKKMSQIHPITWVSTLGLNSLLQAFIYQKPDLGSIPKTWRLGNPIYAAVCSGNKKAVDILCAGGADVNQEGGWHDYALRQAACNDDFDMVGSLLRHGAEVNRQGGNYYDSALQAASRGGHTRIVRLLLQEGAEVNAQGGTYGSALQAAAASGNIATVQFLVQNGANINPQGGDFGTVLGSAINFMAGTDTIRFLLKAGVDVNAQGGSYGTALSAAAACGEVETFRLLLQAGADIYARGNSRGPALQVAVAELREVVVKVLLDASTDNRYQDIWDTMCDKLKKDIQEFQGKKKKIEKLRKARSIQEMLDQWLVKHDSQETVDVEDKSEQGVEDAEVTALVEE